MHRRAYQKACGRGAHACEYCANDDDSERCDRPTRGTRSRRRRASRRSARAPPVGERRTCAWAMWRARSAASSWGARRHYAPHRAAPGSDVGRRRGRRRRGRARAGGALPTNAATTAPAQRGILLEADGPLAAAIVARGMRRTPPRIVDATQAASPARSPVALAAIVVGGGAARARRRGAAGARGGPRGGARARRPRRQGPRRCRAEPPTTGTRRIASRRHSRSRGAARGGDAADRVEASFTVLVDDEAFHARASVPFALAARAVGPAWDGRALAALGERVRLSLPIVACATLSTAADVGALARGDVDARRLAARRTRRAARSWALCSSPPRRETSASPRRSRKTGASSSAARGCRSASPRRPARTPAGRRMWYARRAVRSALRRRRATRSSKRSPTRSSEAVGEVPVVVRVEIGVATMRAREWATLGRGDVIALGRPIGDAVTLRVGGLAVARGELVDIEGEVGVRILGRAPTEDA